MSNKPWAQIDPLDQLIRQTVNASMLEDGVLLTIEFRSGFAKSHARSETYGHGYRVTGRGVTVEREDLDDALLDWATVVGAGRPVSARSTEKA